MLRRARRFLVPIWIAFAIMRLNAQDESLREYNAQKLTIQLQEAFAGTEVGGISAAPVAGKSSSTWFAFKGFDAIPERDFYEVANHPELVERSDEYGHRRSTAYWTMGGMAAAGVTMVVTAAYLWPNPGAMDYPYHFGLGTGGGGVGTLVTVIGFALIPASLLPLFHLPPERTVSYPAALDIAEEYNHGLRISLHIPE